MPIVIPSGFERWLQPEHTAVLAYSADESGVAEPFGIFAVLGMVVNDGSFLSVRKHDLGVCPSDLGGNGAF
jgi:hypothetical protein